MKKLLLFLLLPLLSFAQHNGVSNGTLAFTTGNTGFSQCLSPASIGYVTLNPTLPSYAAGTPVCYEGFFNFTSTTSRYLMGNSTVWSVQVNNLTGNGLIKLNCGIGGQIFSTAAVNDGNWHHIAVQWDFYNYVSLYIDGVLQGVPIYCTNSGNTLQYIGNATNTVGNSWTGTLDEFAVTAGLKYPTNFTPPSAPLVNSAPNQVALYHFNGDLTDANTTYSGVVSTGAYLTKIGLTTTSLTASVPTGGTSPYTYQWQRANDNSGVPGSFTNVSGATSITINDSGLGNSIRYWYRLNITDETLATYTTNIVSAITVNPAAYSFGFIGDSITAGFNLTDPTFIYFPTIIKDFLAGYVNGNKQVNIVNTGIVGSTASQWGSGGGALNAAIANFTANGVKIVNEQLGTNDSNATNNVSASAFKTSLQGICTALTSAGFIVVLDYPIYPNDGRSQTQINLLESYFPQIDALVNGTTIRAGDKISYYQFKANALKYTNGTQGSYMGSDGLHPNQLGCSVIAVNRAPIIALIAGIIPNSLAVSGPTNF